MTTHSRQKVQRREHMWMHAAMANTCGCMRQCRAQTRKRVHTCGNAAKQTRKNVDTCDNGAKCKHLDTCNINAASEMYLTVGDAGSEDSLPPDLI